MTKAQIVNFMGAPGVGKTVLAKKLSAQQPEYRFFEREVLLDILFEQERDTPRYNALAGYITKFNFDIATECAKQGISVVVEAPMKPAIQGKPASFIDAALAAAAKDGFGVSLIYCVAPAETVLAYLKQRGAPRDEPKYDQINTETGWPWFLKTFIDVPGPIQYEHLRVDTTRPVDENLGRIVEYLHRQNT